ncbi:spore germination protein GerPE [Caldibacillus debilis]|jgi:spore germination protein PE|uniref:Spore germination protein GerPE n=1 Tax=Caldibacillus debilis GB1 TaxID=1339248 RepID=A0A420VDB5_9BACI|nr:spore germination protein GerPE [Caldibacillus debilis]RKO61560.1 Protein of unknown function (DUF2772) [Caldibacillus debilis GB1]
MKRVSRVHSVLVETISFSSLLQIGDSMVIDGCSRAIAVQREKELFFGSEGNFSAYPVFRHRIRFPETTPVPLLTRQERGSINVNRVHVTGLAASSILHIGSNEQTRLESRIKHIRQLESENKKNGNGEIFIK